MATKFMSTSSDQGFYAHQHRQSKSHPRHRKVAGSERINKAIVHCPGLGMVRGSKMPEILIISCVVIACTAGDEWTRPQNEGWSIKKRQHLPEQQEYCFLTNADPDRGFKRLLGE
jgi:hypothetical protein